MTAPKKFEDPTARQPIAQAPDQPTHTGSAGDGNLAEPMPLGAFLRGIALIYDLSPKAIQKVIKNPRTVAKSGPRERFSRPLGVMLALSVTVLLVVKFTSGRTQGVLPAPLRVEWTTDSPSHRDRRFTIAASELTFRTGARADSFTIHKIRHVTQSASGEDTTNFSVDYEAEGGLVTWEFQYVQRPKPTIRFSHQKDLIWTPVATGNTSQR